SEPEHHRRVQTHESRQVSSRRRGLALFGRHERAGGERGRNVLNSSAHRILSRESQEMLVLRERLPPPNNEKWRAKLFLACPELSRRSVRQALLGGPES